MFHFYKILLFVGLSYGYTSLNTLWKWKNKNRNLLINNSNSNSNSNSNKENYVQCVISSKNKTSFCNNESKLFIDNNDFYSNKKLITISPGGFKGFYILGVLAFLKEHYNLDNYIFSGASAGAWNCLFMCYKGNTKSIVYDFLDSNIRKAKSISELQYFLKYKLLSCYSSNDFDLRKVFIGVTTFKHFIPNVNIYSDFEDLDDAINCCMASSHIPLITGGVTNRYKDMFSFDGGFSTYPYLNKERTIHISLSMWDELREKVSKEKETKEKKQKNVKNIINFKKFYEFFSISKNNLLELFDNGYEDAKLNKHYLDNIFTQNLNQNPNTNPNSNINIDTAIEI